EENNLLTPVARLSAFWLDLVLTAVPGRIIIFLDEIDSLLSLDPNNFSTDDFFGAIRSLYNNRAKRPELERLNFCIIGVAIPDDLMADPSRTPFNIGTPINLENLSPSEAAPLEQGLEGKEAPASEILQEIMYWTNGQPYLTQRLCLEASKIPIADPKKEVKALVDFLFLHPEKMDQDSNLANVRRRFLGIPEHAEQMILTYDRIVRGKKVPVDLRRREQIYLKLSGLIMERKDHLVINTRIYQAVFNQAWVDILKSELNRPFESELKSWLENEKNKDFLLRGAALENALIWSYKTENVTEEETAFLNASKNYQERKEAEEKRRLNLQRRRLAVGLVFSIGLLIVAILTSLFAFRQQRLIQESNLLLESQADSLAELNQINGITRDSLAQSVQFTKRANIELQKALSVLEETQRALQVSLKTTQTALQRSLLAEDQAQRASRLSDSLATLLGYSSEALSISLLAENLAETNPNLSLQLSNYAYENYGVELTRKNLVKRWINNDLHQKAVIFNVGEILTVETGPSDNLAITGGRDGEVLLWKIEEGEVIQRYRGHTGPIVKALFSPDGTKIITASEDATIRLWDTNSGILLQTYSGHIGPIYDLALSPNGQQFASIGEDQNIIFWDITSGNEVNRIFPLINLSYG
ncbi:MAG: AAA-like domain-containing protein, partial [Bacteroidota bacterium]